MNLPEKIAVIGVGYVGLPLAVCFSKEFGVTAFDLNARRIEELQTGYDRNNEATPEELKSAHINFTHRFEDLAGHDFFVVTVPTPVDAFNAPDLNPLYSACDTLSQVMRPGSTIVFESTVYPGLTEEILAPRLERNTGLVLNRDFFIGYSPERVNPGDKEHTISKIKKVVSGSTPETLERVAAVYGSVISAGIHKAGSIATAEAAKVIENIQRDVNIGLINELTVLFERLGLNTHDVLEASGTKWNFLRFKPGLVGGHCIGVDPFYLTWKAQEVGHHPEMILAGRRINDNMALFYADKLLKHLLRRQISPIEAAILCLGFTFKENCPDTRNTKVFDMVRALEQYGMKVDIVDPVADRELAAHDYGVNLLQKVPEGKRYAAAVFAVPHRLLLEMGADGLRSFVIPQGFILDIKGLLPKNDQVVH